MGDYVGVMTPQAKNGKNRPPQGRPGKGVKCEGQIWVIYLFIFYRISCPPLETTFLHRSTPFLRQMTCFGGD